MEVLPETHIAVVGTTPERWLTGVADGGGPCNMVCLTRQVGIGELDLGGGW